MTLGVATILKKNWFFWKRKAELMSLVNRHIDLVPHARERSAIKLCIHVSILNGRLDVFGWRVLRCIPCAIHFGPNLAGRMGQSLSMHWRAHWTGKSVFRFKCALVCNWGLVAAGIGNCSQVRHTVVNYNSKEWEISKGNWNFLGLLFTELHLLGQRLRFGGSLRWLWCRRIQPISPPFLRLKNHI